MSAFRTPRRIIGLLAAGAILLAGLLYCVFRFEIQAFLHRDLIRPAAERYRVPPRLVAAVIWQESRFRAECVGDAGERGLMQIMPAAAREWAQAEGVGSFRLPDLFDPTTNVMAGTWYLGRALRRWADRDDPPAYALAEYNAGHANAVRWAEFGGANPGTNYVDRIDKASTRKYVQDVLTRYRGDGWPSCSR
jgi:soluble lytic murein transglycosylase